MDLKMKKAKNHGGGGGGGGGAATVPGVTLFPGEASPVKIKVDEVPVLQMAPGNHNDREDSSGHIHKGREAEDEEVGVVSVTTGVKDSKVEFKESVFDSIYDHRNRVSSKSIGSTQNLNIPIAAEIAPPPSPKDTQRLVSKEQVTEQIREILNTTTAVAEVVPAKDDTVSSSDATSSKNNKTICWMIIVLLCAGGVVGAILAVKGNNNNKESPLSEESNSSGTGLVPSSSPVEAQTALSDSSSTTTTTTSTTLSTLEAVKERGYLRCGLYATYVGFSRVEESAGIASGFNWDLCRAVAAVVLGDANAVEPFVATAKTRFTSLKDDLVDVVAMTTTHNMGRDVWEDNALVGAAYSVPYVYTGMAFAGKPVYVECAEKLDFFTGDCRDLKICVRQSTSYDGRIRDIFPGPELVLGDSHIENFLNLEQDICNVVTDGSAALPESIARSFGYSGEYIVGEKRFSKEPFCLNTREDDPEWTSLVNLVLKALYTADKHGITKDNAAGNNAIIDVLLNGMGGDDFKSIIVDSVSAVGNINELYSRHLSGVAPRTGLNTLNDGTSGLIYSYPFGVVDTVGSVKAGSDIESIIDRGYLRCGLTPGSSPAGLAEFDGEAWNGMDIQYCLAVAAALFSRDAAEAVEYVEISDPSERYKMLAAGEVDLLSGERVTILNGWKESTTMTGYTFSSPYYYENSDDGAFALATRQTDAQFSDLVFWTVMSTFYAEENGISRTNSIQMPLIQLFGEHFKAMFLDIILEVGNYGDIYNETMQALVPRSGRNTLNSDSGPQQFAYPFV